jgi:1,4-alpha-glucan branching enzyme
VPPATDAFDALAGARHADPFSILGPHVDGDALVIRAFQPSADRVEVVHAGGVTEMAGAHDSGGFETRLPGHREVIDYRLRVTYRDGHVATLDDPYRYGRVITEYDIYLFAQGRHTRIYDRLGANLMRIGDADGVHFGVWAPNADRVSVVGDFNAWDGRVHPMRRLGASGVWEIFIPGVGAGDRYKYEIRSMQHGEVLLKADPYGFLFEKPPLSASVVARRDHAWGDAEWLIERAGCNAWFERPMAIYEVHLGSWARVPEEGNRPLTYTEMPIGSFRTSRRWATHISSCCR